MKKNFSEFKDFIKGKKTAVVGIGISNRPLIYFLAELGAEVTAFDRKSESELGDIVNNLNNRGVKLILGENYLDNLKGYEVVFKTPSMRIDSPALQNAQKEGAYITSEMEEFMKYCPAKMFGITGSDGKTTTTTLVYNMLREEGYKTWVGGNIGTPLFTRIEEINKDDRVVLELSSFQLMTITTSPQVAVITNLSPNHLDIHKDMEEYIWAKKNIFNYQSEDELLILNKDNNITNGMVNEAKGKVMQFSRNTSLGVSAYFKDNSLYLEDKEICKLNEIKIKGMHNVENLLTAFCAVSNDASIDSMKKIATTFTGVEHRSEFVREVNGVNYYNDSIGSSPTRTIATISAFEKPVILIAGGYDKKIPFEPLANEGHGKIKVLILIGATKDKIKTAFDDLKKRNGIDIPIIICDSLEEAVRKAKEISSNGDNVVLSPACASFDMFPNFEVRGNKFKEIVNAL